MKPRRARRGQLPVVFEKTETEALLSAANTRCATGLRNRAILEVMYRAGLRVSEVLNLRPLVAGELPQTDDYHRAEQKQRGACYTYR